jgi:hypothetical protein
VGEWGRLTWKLNPSNLSLWLPSFSDHFPSGVSGSVVTLRVCNILNTYVSPLGKNLAFTSFVYNNASGMLENVGSSSLAVVMVCGCGGQFFLNSTLSLDG